MHMPNKSSCLVTTVGPWRIRDPGFCTRGSLISFQPGSLPAMLPGGVGAESLQTSTSAMCPGACRESVVGWAPMVRLLQRGKRSQRGATKACVKPAVLSAMAWSRYACEPSIERELPANPACVCGDALNRALLVLGRLVQPRFVPGAVWSPVKGPVLMDRVFASLLHGPRAHRSTVWCVVYGLGRRFRSSALDSAFANVHRRPPAPSGSARDVPRSRSWPPSLFDAQDLLRSRSRLVPPRCRDPALRLVPERFLLVVVGWRWTAWTCDRAL